MWQTLLAQCHLVFLFFQRISTLLSSLSFLARCSGSPSRRCVCEGRGDEMGREGAFCLACSVCKALEAGPRTRTHARISLMFTVVFNLHDKPTSQASTRPREPCSPGSKLEAWQPHWLAACLTGLSLRSLYFRGMCS